MSNRTWLSIINWQVFKKLLKNRPRTRNLHSTQVLTRNILSELLLLSRQFWRLFNGEEETKANLKREKCWYPVSMDTKTFLILRCGSGENSFLTQSHLPLCLCGRNIFFFYWASSNIAELFWRSRLQCQTEKEENCWIRAGFTSLNAHAWESQDETFDWHFLALLVCDTGTKRFSSIFPRIVFRL